MVLDKLAVAERAGASIIERTIREVAQMLVMNDALYSANIYENLHALLPWTQRMPPLRAFVRRVNQRHDSWSHDDTGRVDNAPTVVPEEQCELSAQHLADLRRLAFVQLSPTMLHPPTLAEHTRKMWAAAAPPPSPPLPKRLVPPLPPTAVVTVGTPGSGKSFVAIRDCLPVLAEMGLGPSESQYLKIDPDFWLSQVCHNDNGCRPLVNWLNHENFLRACRRRQHIFFDGTGKSLLNTCGRVIARLRSQGYRVHIVIVLASFETCMSNVRERFERTGRDVPKKIVLETFKFLAQTARVYISRQAAMCDRVIVYDNDKLQSHLAVTVTEGRGEAEALALCDKYLTLPAKPGK